MCPPTRLCEDHVSSAAPQPEKQTLSAHNPSSNDHVDADLLIALQSDIKHIPARFLYDTLGSDIYERITQLKEYYPYNEEKSLLHRHAQSIIQHLSPGSIIIELGCGDGSKTGILLNALAHRDGPHNVHFIGIDVSAGALLQAQRNFVHLCPTIPASNINFIEAEYLPGLLQARQQHPDASLCFLWLGSSVGNFNIKDAAEFLKGLQHAAGSNSSLLLCTDLWKKSSILHAAYDDSQGVTREFIINGMKHMLRTLKHPCAGEDQSLLWDYEVIVNAELRQVEMWLIAQRDIKDVLPCIDIVKGERVLMEISRKFTREDISSLAFNSLYCIEGTWSSNKYSMQLLLPPAQAMKHCWMDTDDLFAYVSSSLSPDWSAQPIGLRHPFLFYYGHCAAFSRIKLNQSLKQGVLCMSTKESNGAMDTGGTRESEIFSGFIKEESSMDVMFSRGIDPGVLDPSHCHAHPDVPLEWPKKKKIQEYVSQIRYELLELLSHECVLSSPHAMHAVMMSLEHEREHQETLCYMMSQQNKHQFGAVHEKKDVLIGILEEKKVCPFFTRNNLMQRGMGERKTDNVAVSRCNGTNGTHSMMNGCTALLTVSPASCHQVKVPSGNVILGVPCNQPTGFVWDNERGSHGPIKVNELSVQSMAVTIGEFLRFIVDLNGYEDASLWKSEDFEYIRKNNIKMPATWSQDESGIFYVHMPEGTYVLDDKIADFPVYVSLFEALAYCKAQKGRIMTEAELVHIQNVALQQEEEGNRNAVLMQQVADDIAHGGGWEWTSTVFKPFDGFVVDSFYPEYSTDFFDDNHYVLRGCSAYTSFSLQRSTFRNFYQPQYPFVFAKFRVVFE